MNGISITQQALAQITRLNYRQLLSESALVITNILNHHQPISSFILVFEFSLNLPTYFLEKRHLFEKHVRNI